MSLGSSLMSSFQAQPTACIDTPLWDNNSGRRCADYSREGWCRNGMLTLTWTGGAQFNHPERECCACGKGATATATMFTHKFIEQAPQRTSAPAVTPAAAVPNPPRDAALATLLDALPATEREAVQARLSTCAATHAAPRAAADTLLYVPRLPRTGNGLMCNLLSTCSARQARQACGTPVALADVNNARSLGCPSGATPFAFYGNEKLKLENFGCAAGVNSSMPSCNSFGGDAAASCQFLGSIKAPGAVMVATERFPEFAVAPCPAIRPAIRLMALLRDPGERVQSAFTYTYQNCVCNFNFPWCTMFTSFRFKNRQTKLCDDHTPKHGFAAGVSELRAHGNMPWSITSSEMPHILGRFAAGLVREVYAPYFGGYRASEGGPWRSSSLLGRATLARCFAWVGIAEECARARLTHLARRTPSALRHALLTRCAFVLCSLPTSLKLLKHEMPELFGNVDVSHFQWSPTSSDAAADALAGNSSKHPYLRSHLLTRDYDIYDAERKRLQQRARRAGIIIEEKAAVDFF